MSNTRVASRYAKSLLDLAQEQGVLDEVKDDMLLFTKVIDANRGLALALSSPIVQNGKKLAVLKGIFFGKVHKLTLSIFEIITRKNREALLPAIAKEFARQYNEVKQIQSAVVITPFGLTDDLRTRFGQLVEKHSGKKVSLIEKVDASLIGGYVLNIGDLQIDESVKSKLQTLRVKMIDHSYVDKI
jgi:F-type H+-transporting ATPase subunit delta